jgi:hypothetical protein
MMMKPEKVGMLARASIAMLALSCRPPAVIAQSSACLSADPLASSFVSSVRALYADPRIDSTKWKSSGFPFTTGAAISLVTDNKTCASAVKAFNQSSKRANTPQAVTQLYVARIGSTGYVVMFPQETGPGEWRTYYWFTTRWVLKQQMAG